MKKYKTYHTEKGKYYWVGLVIFNFIVFCINPISACKGFKFYWASFGLFMAQSQISKTNRTYSEKVTYKIVTGDKVIKYGDKQVTKYPDHDYLKKRLNQCMTKGDKKITKCDNVMNSIPDKPEQCIRTKLSLPGLEIKNLSQLSEDMIPVKLV